MWGITQKDCFDIHRIKKCKGPVSWAIDCKDKYSRPDPRMEEMLHVCVWLLNVPFHALTLLITQ